MLEVSGVSKSFGVVKALAGVDLTVAAGEVRALLGSNGAGKSTLMKIISGADRPDSGTVRIEGNVTDFATTAHAVEAGVAAVYQELSLIPGLTVAENIMLGRWRKRRGFASAVIDVKLMREDAAEALSRLGESLPLTALVGTLSVGQQQIIEIAKALSHNPRLLILDEPTSALSKEEADRLIALVRKLASQGIAVLYVSHRMDEIARVADSMTIMRDGHVVTTIPSGDLAVSEVARLMVGEDRMKARTEPRTVPSEEVRLSVAGLTLDGAFSDISFDVRRGEIFGIAGLLGSGRTELLRCVFGRDRADSGSITIDGQNLGLPDERTTIGHGVGLTPEDRKTQGVILGLPISTNLGLAAFHRFVRAGIVLRTKERTLTTAVSDELSIKAAKLSDPVSQLSGGNQQKVVIGKWLVAESQILLLDEPTRGIDVHAKMQVYELILALAAQGRSVVVVSSEMEELFEVCHTIGVLNHGRLISVDPAERTDLAKTLELAMKEM